MFKPHNSANISKRQQTEHDKWVPPVYSNPASPVSLGFLNIIICDVHLFSFCPGKYPRVSKARP
eukprot:scaffold202287_cov17-Prasinocladus_malaysianus.AAC.1